MVISLANKIGFTISSIFLGMGLLTLMYFAEPKTTNFSTIQENPIPISDYINSVKENFCKYVCPLK